MFASSIGASRAGQAVRVQLEYGHESARSRPAKGRGERKGDCAESVERQVSLIVHRLLDKERSARSESKFDVVLLGPRVGVSREFARGLCRLQEQREQPGGV